MQRQRSGGDVHTITAYPGDIIRLMDALSQTTASDWQKRTALRILHVSGIRHALDTVSAWTPQEATA